MTFSVTSLIVSLSGIDMLRGWFMRCSFVHHVSANNNRFLSACDMAMRYVHGRVSELSLVPQRSEP